MTGLDSYYTPISLANKLVDFVPTREVKSVVDFCVGDGDLLKAVAKRYPSAKLYGTDISDEALKNLSNDCPEWNLETCDFRKDESIDNVSFMHNIRFDLIMLNPPFTCRGSIVEHVELDEKEFHVSTAMFFFVRALRYLSNDGGLYAVLPISCVRSEKDQVVWDYLQKHYNACVLDYPRRVSFSKRCSPNIVLVYAGQYQMEGAFMGEHADFSALPAISVVRGCIRMQAPLYSKKKESIPLIHTTNIQNGKLVGLKKIIIGKQLVVDGDGVVIPRVCNPSRNKIALLDGAHIYALSDCVIVIRTANKDDAEQIRTHILNHWLDFLTIYSGTGAQYTTLAKVKALFGVV